MRATAKDAAVYGTAPDSLRVNGLTRRQAAAAWLDVWNRIHSRDPRLGPSPVPPLPEIDFSREIVVVAAMGSRPTAGYFISIDGAHERDNLLEVVVRSVETRCGGFTILTAPLAIVRLPKTERSVVFREIEVAVP